MKCLQRNEIHLLFFFIPWINNKQKFINRQKQTRKHHQELYDSIITDWFRSRRKKSEHKQDYKFNRNRARLGGVSSSNWPLVVLSSFEFMFFFFQYLCSKQNLFSQRSDADLCWINVVTIKLNDTLLDDCFFFSGVCLCACEWVAHFTRISSIWHRMHFFSSSLLFKIYSHINCLKQRRNCALISLWVVENE